MEYWLYLQQTADTAWEVVAGEISEMFTQVCSRYVGEITVVIVMAVVGVVVVEVVIVA